MTERYLRPGWITQHVFNPLVASLTRIGVSLRGSRVLEVRGRTTGEWRRTPVNPIDFEGSRYLVSPRGNTQWVRNLRVNPEGRLLVGRRVEPFTAKEISDLEKPRVLRAYLTRWKWEVGAFFDAGPGATDEQLAAIAPAHPVFRIAPR
jgi:deazaflavin-dependent oxidoreductase (nitroreductase family)